MKKIFYITIFFVLWGCATSEKSTTDNANTKDEVYVFDSIGLGDVNAIKEEPQLDKKPTEQPDEKPSELNVEEVPPAVESTNEILYYVQIGAFSTKERAKEFVNEVNPIVQKDLKITFNTEKNLHVVQLPPFKTRLDAEKERNRLWKYEPLKGAFIITK